MQHLIHSSRIIKKLSRLPVFSTLLFIFVAFLPMQYRYTGFLKPLSKAWFYAQTNLPSFFDKRLDFYLNELIQIALIAMVFFKFRSRLRQLSSNSFLLLLFLLVSFLSLCFSQSAPYYWPYWRWMQLALPALFSLLVPLGARKSDLPICIAILFALGIFESIVGIAQYTLQGPIGLNGIGESNTNILHFSYINVESKTRWLLDYFLGYQSITTRIMRIAATFPHPNIAGGFFGLSLFAGCYVWLKKRAWRPLTSLLLFVIFFSLCLTYSRAALFGIFGGFCLFALLLWPLISKKTWVKLGLVLVCSALISGGVLHEQFLERGGIINYNEFAGKADQDRVQYQNIALAMAKARPLLGVGWRQYSIEMKRFTSGNATIMHQQTVHNIFLLLAAETGFIGLSLFLAFVAATLWKLWNAPPTYERALLLSIWGFLLWLGCCDHFLITGHQGRLMLFLIGGLSLIFVSSEEKVPLQRPILQH